MIRLEANILPFFGNKTAIRLTDQDMDNYVKHRRTFKVRRLVNLSDRRREVRKRKKRISEPVPMKTTPIKFSTIRRELTDVKSILNWATNRSPKLIPYNPVANWKKPDEDTEKFQPPTLAETRAILNAAGEHLKRFIKLSFFWAPDRGPRRS